MDPVLWIVFLSYKSAVLELRMVQPGLVWIGNTAWTYYASQWFADSVYQGQDVLGPSWTLFCKFPQIRFKIVQICSACFHCCQLQTFVVAVLLATYWPSTHNKNCQFFDSDEMLL